MTTAKRSLLSVTAITLLAVGGLAFWLSQEQEYLRQTSPTGNHTAVITYHRYHSLLPSLPGQSGDKPGYVRITDATGKKYPGVPLPMVSMVHELIWTPQGASITALAEWNFTTGEVRYWDSSQTHETVKKAR